MTSDLTSSFDEQYMNIHTKLKKRFLRKPNLAEVTNEFNALAIQCELSEQPSFAGQAFIGAAECEAAAGNPLGEAEYYLAAARQFMKAQMKLCSLRSDNLINDNLEHAIECFMLAYQKYPEKSLLRTSIMMELANDLDIIQKKRHAVHYYELALDNLEDNCCVLREILFRHLMRLNIDCGCYEIALRRANAICNLDMDIPENTMIEIQITRILLALLVLSPEEKEDPSLKKLFGDLLNDKEDVPFSPDVTVQITSIILAQQAHDMEALVEVAADAKNFMTMQQQDLLIQIIKTMENLL